MDEPREPDGPPSVAPPPEEVAGYRDLIRIGSGGFSVVYRAVQEAFDRPVAIKVLAVGPEDEDRDRFLREARLTGRLTGHPNVVTVLDAGATASGKPYLVTEFCEGGSLRDRLKASGPLAAAEVAAVGAKIAEALAAAHEAGIVHRDVKPNNILISRFGEPALADFGVACVLDSMASESQLNVFSPHHAAPEVVNRGVPDAASDIYSLGSTLYHLATGRPPFDGDAEDMEALLWRIVHEPPPVLDFPDLPALAAVVAMTLEKDPARRPPSAAALARDLRALSSASASSVTRILGAPPVGPPIGAPAAHTPGSDFSATIETTPGHGTVPTRPSAYIDPALIPPPPSGPIFAAPAAARPPRRGPRFGAAVGAAVGVLALAALLLWAPWSQGGGNGAAAAGPATASGASPSAAQAAAGDATQTATPSPSSGTVSASPSSTTSRRATPSPDATPSAKASSPKASASPSATVSTSCFGWVTKNPNPTTYALMSGNDHLYVGPYSACAFVQQTAFTKGTKLWLHCYVVNSFNVTWIFTQVNGASTTGWISASNLTGRVGALAKC